jgi:hypothetical protein
VRSCWRSNFSSVETRLGRFEGCQVRDRRSVFDPRQPKDLEQADVEPAYVEFVPFHRQFCRLGVGVMVVVQLLAADYLA